MVEQTRSAGYGNTDPALFAIDLDALKSDTVALDKECRAFRVGTTAGNVKVVTGGGSTFTFKNVQVGERIDCVVKQIYSAGTSAVGVEGLY